MVRGHMVRPSRLIGRLRTRGSAAGASPSRSSALTPSAAARPGMWSSRKEQSCVPVRLALLPVRFFTEMLLLAPKATTVPLLLLKRLPAPAATSPPPSWLTMLPAPAAMRLPPSFEMTKT